MPTWAWVLSAPLALLILLALGLALLRFRYFLEWRGELSGTLSGNAGGTARVETRFLWVKHVWEPLKDKSWSIADLFSDDGDDEADTGGRKSGADPEPEPRFSERAADVAANPATARTGAPEDPFFLKSPPPGSQPPPRARLETPREKSAGAEKKSADPNRKRRALFRLITDRDAWRLLARYGLKTMRLLMKLLKPRIEAAVGHPDPAFLGRVAGKWYAARPFLPLGRANLYFRFQDRHPSLWVRVQGSFSALSVLVFGVRLVIAFPFILMARRALHGWRRHRLEGWRAWVYRKLQTR